MQCLEEDAEGEKEETGLAPQDRDRGQPSDLFLLFYLIQLLICDESILKAEGGWISVCI